MGTSSTLKTFTRCVLIALFALSSIVGMLFYSMTGSGSLAIHTVDSRSVQWLFQVTRNSENGHIGLKDTAPWLQTITSTERYFNISSTNNGTRPASSSTTLTVTRSSSSPTHSSTRYPYMLSFHYAEQLTSASRHFVSFVNLAAQWGMRAVEPLVVNSRLFGLGIPRTNMYKYSRLFNLSHANEILGSCLLRQSHQSESDVVFKMRDFLADSYKSFVLVYFVRKTPLPSVRSIVSKEDNVHFRARFRSAARTMFDCTDTGRTTGVIRNIESVLNSNKLWRMNTDLVRKFTVSRMICVNHYKVVSLTELRNLIIPSRNTSYRESVLFIKWQGMRTAYKFDEPSCKLMEKCKLDAMPHSAEVFDASKAFLQSLALEKPFLSVHMRTEKLIQNEAFYQGYRICCTRKLLSVINTTVHEHNLKGALVLSDYGTYGTDACFYGERTMPRSFCKLRSDKIVKYLSQGGIQVAEFDVKSFAGVPQNSGFASLVEADALLQGDMLIMMGFGSFQSTMRKKFVELYQDSHTTAPEHCCVSVCPVREEERHGKFIECDVKPTNKKRPAFLS